MNYNLDLIRNEMKKLIALIAMIAIAAGSAFAFIDSYTIDRSKLPEDAKIFLNEYFPRAKVGMIRIDRHLLKKSDYDVRLVNGTTIEFSNKGKWKSVKCRDKAVPDGIIPAAIRRHVKNNYTEVYIKSIVKKSGSYEVGLSDGVILKYNLLGQFKGAIMEEP